MHGIRWTAFRQFGCYRKGADGQPEIVPEEAEIVKQIYRWYIGGYSLAQIQRELEARGLKNARGNTQWSRITVKSILTNEKYMGCALLQKTYTVDCISKTVRKSNGELPMILVEDHHKPIIAKAVFQWVQEEMKRRTSRRKVLQKSAKTEQGKYSSKYALTERLVCGECGSPYKRCTWNVRGKKRIVWRCVSRLEYGKKYCHNSPTVDEDKLHAGILTAINQFADRETAEAAAAELVEMVVTGSASQGKSVAQMQSAVAEITAEQERLLLRILEDMDNPELNARMQTLTEQKNNLLCAIDQRKTETAQKESEQLRMQEVRAWIAAHPAGIQDYDDAITRRLIEQITVVQKDLVRIKFIDENEETNIPLT